MNQYAQKNKWNFLVINRSVILIKADVLLVINLVLMLAACVFIYQSKFTFERKCVYVTIVS